jgi:hypothetical protein
MKYKYLVTLTVLLFKQFHLTESVTLKKKRKTTGSEARENVRRVVNECDKEDRTGEIKVRVNQTDLCVPHF